MGVPLVLVLALAWVSPAGAASAARLAVGESSASITVAGAATEGHTFDAFQVAGYGEVTSDGQGRPVAVELQTATAELKGAVAEQVAHIQAARGEAVPNVSPGGTLDGLDPFQWVALNWPQDGSTSDLWGNPGATSGPLRDLANWLGSTVLTAPARFGLEAASQTGATTDGAPGVTFTGLPAGLYAVAPAGGESGTGAVGTGVAATASATLLVGTQIPVGGTLHDLYGDDGRVARALGVVNVKGDAVSVTKSVAGDPSGFAGGDAVPMVIETRLPHFDLFDAGVAVQFEITDTHSSGLGEPDWGGVDGRVADPVLTVGDLTLRFDASCEVGVANTSDACFGVVSTSSTTGAQWRVGVPDWVARAHGGQAVTLTYEQVLSPAAASGQSLVPTRDMNRVQVTFSHDPARPGSTTTGGAEVAVFTFPLHLTKRDATSGKPLAGVEFAISAGDVARCFAPADDGTYWHTGTAPCASGTSGRLTTARDGTLTVHGLAGNTTYTVAETKQPAGYHPGNLDTARFTVRANPQLSPDGSTVTLLDYTFANAGTARHLEAFLTAETATTTVPTSDGHERREYTTGHVTVLNSITGPAAITGGMIRTAGLNAPAAVLAAMLLAASGTFFALAARRRRADAATATGPATTPPSTPAPEPAP